MNWIPGISWKSFPFIILFFTLNYQTIWMAEMYFDRIELLNESYVEGLYKVNEMRITKFNRTTYVLNGEAEFYYVTNDSVKVEMSFHYNRFNNNQYAKSLMRVPKDSLCKIVEKYYPIISMQRMNNVTNFPIIEPGEKYCPLPKVCIPKMYNFFYVYLHFHVKFLHINKTGSSGY